MHTRSRLTRLTRSIERKQAHRRPAPDIWIFYDPATCRDGIEDTTNARNARTGELRPIADLPEDCTRIVVTYDRTD